LKRPVDVVEKKRWKEHITAKCGSNGLMSIVVSTARKERTMDGGRHHIEVEDEVKWRMDGR
jgi:hypothetical protein